MRPCRKLPVGGPVGITATRLPVALVSAMVARGAHSLLHSFVSLMADSDVDLSPGTLAISAPMMQDPNFRRTVILICEHQPGEGSFGLVLNRELDVQLGEVLEGDFAYDPSLYLGGPVQRETLHYLHSRPQDIPDGISLPGGVEWGGDFERAQALAQSGDVSTDDIRFFLGYSGWGPGQLEDELNDEAWILAPGASDLVFEAPPDDLWRTALRRKGGEYALLSNFPDDPRMN